MNDLQQVNLYLTELRPQQQPFRFIMILYTWGITAAFFTVIQYWGWNQTQNAETHLSDLNKQEIKVLQQLQTLRANAPRNARAQLEQKLTTARAELVQRQQLMDTMKQQEMGNSSGFSEYLIGLSRQHADGLSLELIELGEGGRTVELSGWTRTPELVPDYVQRLRQEASFHNTRFGEMSIERSPNDRIDALRFSLGDGSKEL
jgi:hypothetical protein